MHIDRKLVTHVASLANIELSEADIEYYEAQLSKILDYVDQLRSMPDNLGPDWRGDVLTGPAPERVDEVLSSLPVDVALANAPERGVGGFRVPRIIE